MKVTKEIDYKVRIKAVLDEDGQMQVSLVAIAPYGSRTATATVTDFQEELLVPIQKALSKLLQAEGPRAVVLAEQAAATSHAVAIARGETI